MRLTSFTDFGLRALMFLARDPERSASLGEIADTFAISRNHLIKVVQELARSGFVVTQRGVSGGVRLARPPEAIRLGEVVRILEARHALVECFESDGGTCRLVSWCGLRHRLAAANEAFLVEMDRSTLADCVGSKMTAAHVVSRGTAIEGSLR